MGGPNGYSRGGVETGHHHAIEPRQIGHHFDLGKAGANVLRKVFGVILLAIAIKLFKTNLPI